MHSHHQIGELPQVDAVVSRFDYGDGEPCEHFTFITSEA